MAGGAGGLIRGRRRTDRLTDSDGWAVEDSFWSRFVTHGVTSRDQNEDATGASFGRVAGAVDVR